MPPILRRSNSVRSKVHRRIFNSFTFKLLGLTIVCTSGLLTVNELSSVRDLTAEDGREHWEPARIYFTNAREDLSVLHLHQSSGHSRLEDDLFIRERVGRNEKDVDPFLSSSRRCSNTTEFKAMQDAEHWNQDSVFEDAGTKERQGDGKQQHLNTQDEAIQLPLRDGNREWGKSFLSVSESVDRYSLSRRSKLPKFFQNLLDILAPWLLFYNSNPLHKHFDTDTAALEVGVDCKTVRDAPSSISKFKISKVIPKCWMPPKQCGTAEEMGAAAVGDTRAASLRIRRMIETWIAGNGAEVVRTLSGADFCERKFVFGLASEDGFGNNMYKVLTAAGLALILNRSLIIGERGANTPSYLGDTKNIVLPFGDYLMYSNQSFSMREVKHLWALHDCAGKHNQTLTMRVDDIEHGPGRSKSLCDDWTTLSDTVLWFKGTLDTVALQFLLKNNNAAMRSASAMVLGNPSVPSSRPNTYGELLRAFVTPKPEIEAAVEWALKGGPDPDFALHLRLRHNRSQEAPVAASNCILHILQENQQRSSVHRKKQRAVVISDTPEIFNQIKRQLGDTIELVQFDYMEYVHEFKNLSEVMSLNYGQPPRSKMRDWGEMPRWVSLVDFFLAARARVAVVSGANERVCTTYVQLVGSLAAASTLTEEDEEGQRPCAFFSSFQRDLVAQGLMKQSGWGHAWRTFGGKLGCKDQGPQCAKTPLLPYAWWDAPWQSPTTRDIRKMQSMGIEVDELGQILEKSLDGFCEAHQKLKPTVYKLKLPS